VNLDTQGGHVLLFEFTSQMSLDEGGLFVAMDVSINVKRLKRGVKYCTQGGDATPKEAPR
jgi:hypothetical protein